MRANYRDVTRTSEAARLDSYPYPYPTGWYRLAESATLGTGDIRYIECLGRQLVLWRGADGEAHVMHAFCPHLGANLSFGRVRDTCIECPFHHWRFTSDGRAAQVPYSDHVPKGILTETFPVQEAHGRLFMYHACDGGRQSASDTPPYPVPRIAQVDEGAMVLRGAHDAGRVRMHILEFAENAADLAHFEPIHSHMRIPWTRLRVPCFTIDHEANWEADSDVPWKMYFSDKTRLRVLGRLLSGASASSHVTFHGPASLVWFRIRLANRGDIQLCQTHLPVAPLEQQVNYRWFADPQLPRWLVWYIVGSWISQWIQDIHIWENKKYVSAPKLCRDDGPLFRLRRWYAQFLPDTDADERLPNLPPAGIR